MRRQLLFIGPKFYNYHEIIKSGFEKRGFEVDYYDDRPSTSFFTKAFMRINRNFVKKKIKKHFKNILEKSNSKKYDIVFILYGQSFDTRMIKKLKKSQPMARFIFYMYDPISSMPDRVEFSKEFDKAYTFDYDDFKRYPNFGFLPLFYSFRELPKEEIIYDACFIGTMMPGKYKLVKNIINQFKKHNLKVFDYEYIQGKSVALYYKIFKSDFKKAKFSDFVYRRLSNVENNKKMMQSKYIIDCPKEGQTGLTIRTFEALGSNKKLITTNKSIKNYDFYKPENIYIVDGEIDFNNIFFHSEYIENTDLKEKYSIDTWINEILS